MMVYGIPPSLRGGVYIFSLREVFPQDSKVLGMWDYFLAPH
jgi:hypothetical protein